MDQARGGATLHFKLTSVLGSYHWDTESVLSSARQRNAGSTHAAFQASQKEARPIMI